ncbi:MAG: GNAT family N-acetyltransferase [Woeseiaceae bacterium]
MIVRHAHDDDVGTMMDIRLAVRENAMSRAELASRGITVVSLVDMLNSTHTGFCAEDDNGILGFAMADNDDASIFALFVRPEFEGRGIGSELLAAAVDHLVSHGNDRLTLDTGPDTRAFDFYIRKGWKHIGPTDHDDVLLEYRVTG